MAVVERQRRSAPKREAPKRAVLARGDEVNGKETDLRAGAAADDGVIGAVVAAAYRVVEDNVQQGRRAAERLRAAASETPEAAPNAKAVASRLVHITRDLGAAWVDLLVAVLREPEVRAVVDRITMQDRARPAASAPSPPLSIAQRVRSRKPLEVTLSALPPLAAGGAPGVAGLHALGTGSPPLQEVSFALDPAGALQLEIVVPDDQPADVYTGTVVDTATRLPIGCLTVRILE
jgi:hypothetical protein